jgi:hypothetical protein
MLRICSLGVAVWLAWQTSAVAQGPKPVEPDRFSAGVETVSKGALKEAAGSVADVVGQPTGAQNIQSALQVFEGKKFDFVKKVVDKELAGSAPANHLLFLCRETRIRVFSVQFQNDEQRLDLGALHVRGRDARTAAPGVR